MVEEVKTGSLVIPGDELSIIEAFTPGKNVYEENGKICSATIGIILKDMVKREVSVYPRTRIPVTLERGDIVLAEIIDVKEKFALADIAAKIYPRKTKLLSKSPGVIPISNVKKTYLKNLYGAFLPGDIVKTRVIEVKNGIAILTVSSPDLGVIYGYCEKCRNPVQKEKRMLKCRKCGNVIKNRKISRDYGKSFYV